MRRTMSKRVICFVLIGTMVSPFTFHVKAAVQKDEAVYVSLENDGTVKEKTVSDWLHADVPGQIKDASSLINIKNIKGSETPIINGKDIIWNTSKNDIFYEGDSEEDNPVSVSLDYYINGEKIQPSNLSGKTGQFKLVIKYTNHDAHMANINGKFKTIYTPMIALSIVDMPMEKFKNIKVSSGQILSEGNNQLVSSVVFPGMKDSLNIEDDLINLELKDEIEITADVTDFSLKPIYIAVTPKIPDIDILKNTGSISELQDGIVKMKDASLKLTEGTKELMDNLQQAKDGATSLKDGVLQAKGAMDQVNSNISQNKDKLELITVADNVLKENKLISDALYAKDIDTTLISKITTKENMNSILKTLGDYKQSGIDEFLGSHEEILSLLNNPNLPENLTQDIVAAKALSDSSAGLIEAASNVDIEEVKTLLAPIYPVLSETNSAKLDAEIKTINALAQEGHGLTQTINQLDSEKLKALLQGLSPILMENNKAALDAKLKGLNTLLTYGNDINNTLQLVDAVKLKSSLDGVSGVLLEEDDAKLQAKISILKTLLGTSVDFDKVLNAVNLETLQGLNKPLGDLLSDKTKEEAFISSIAGLKDMQGTAPTFINTEITNSGNYMKASEFMATSEQQAALLSAINGSSLDDTTKTQMITLIGLTAATRSNISGGAESLGKFKTQIDSYGNLLSDPSVSALLNWITEENIDNLKPLLAYASNIGSIKNNLDASKDLLSGFDNSLTFENVKNLRPILKYASSIDNFNQMKGTLNATMPMLNSMGTSLTVDNIENVTPILSYVARLQDIKPLLNGVDPMLVGVSSTLNSQSIRNIQPILLQLDNIEKLQVSLKENKSTIMSVVQVLNSLSNKTEDIKMSTEKLQVLLGDCENASVIMKDIGTPEALANLKQAPDLVTDLTSMQSDLKNSENILKTVADALSQGNIKLATDLIAALPQLSDGVVKLSEGSTKLSSGLSMLYDGSKALNTGMSQFNSDGILKLDSEVTPKLSSADELLQRSQELMKLSQNYKTFSGNSDDMQCNVKFIMKTSEIKNVEKKEVKKVVEKKKKLSFLQWLKSII